MSGNGGAVLRRLYANAFEDMSAGVLQQFDDWVNGDYFRSLDRTVDYQDAMRALKVPVLLVGGNKDMLGWRLVGFPGQQFGYADAYINRAVDMEPMAVKPEERNLTTKSAKGAKKEVANIKPRPNEDQCG